MISVGCPTPLASMRPAIPLASRLPATPAFATAVALDRPSGRRPVAFHRQPVRYAPGQRHLVGILQLTPKGDTPGDSGYATRPALKLFLDIIDRCIALNRRVQRKDQLLRLLLADTVDQRLYIQLLGADAVKRGNDPAQNVIGAVELLSAFDGDDLPKALHHTDDLLFTGKIGADRTDIRVGDVMTPLAEFDLLAHPDHGFPETLYIPFFHP